LPSASRSSINDLNVTASAALIDIEGTVGSIAFVRDVLFPYARERIAAFVEERKEQPEMRAILDAAAREAAVDPHDLPAIVRALHDWSDRDVKITPLKTLQGLIWTEGYERSGALKGHLYADAIDALQRFHDAGVALYVYSSGSVAAQRLLFGHSVAGDLTGLFSGYFDTTIGGKREAPSYTRIAEAIHTPPNRIVFFSDNEQELDAAKNAELQTVQLARPEDGTVRSSRHPCIDSFTTLKLSRLS
jgi:enolase-phosphatase E1